MSFKFIITLYTLFIVFGNHTELNMHQSEPDLITSIINDKPTSYFKLQDYINKRYLSLEDAERLLNLSKIHNYALGEVYALNSIGRNHRNKSKYKTALVYHQQALDVCKENDFVDAQILCLNLIGVIYRRQDDIRNALDYHQSALSLAKTIKSPSLENKKSISISENSIGNIYLNLRQYELALEKFYKSIRLQKQLDDQRGLAINYQNIGKALEQLGSLDEALESYNQSLTINNLINSNLGKVICKNSISSILIKKGDYKKALSTIQNTYKEALNLKDNYYISQTLSNFGWAELKNNHIESAENKLLEAKNLSEEFNIKHTHIESLFRLAELYEKKNDIVQSYYFYKEGIKEEKETLGQRNILYVNNLIAKHDLQSKSNEINNLENVSKIKTLQLARNRNILIITLVTIALLSVALYSVYRQRLLQNDQKVLLLEQQALQTQMNPHFIFNALNSIKLYIINNEQKNAAYYLNKFSKLIRNILDVSKVKEVSLKDELKTMDLYMTIENIRFSNEIEYTEAIHPDLNTDTIKLPPLVLQPFIENAIWHGLSSKEGSKKITVSAEKIEDNLIEISITDNGIGRPAAMEIKKNKSLKRKSIGIELTKERLKTFTNDSLKEFNLTYHDLTDEKGHPIGTKVAIRLPID